MAEFYTLEKETLTNIADAIRLKRDITDEITPEDMPMQIGLIEGGVTIEQGSVVLDNDNISITVPITNDGELIFAYLFAEEPWYNVNSCIGSCIIKTSMPLNYGVDEYTKNRNYTFLCYEIRDTYRDYSNLFLLSNGLVASDTSVTEDSITFYSRSNTYRFLKNKKYNWIAYKKKGD